MTATYDGPGVMEIRYRGWSGRPDDVFLVSKDTGPVEIPESLTQAGRDVTMVLLPPRKP